MSTESLAPTMALWSDTETVVAVIRIDRPESAGDVNAPVPSLLSVEPAVLPADAVSEVIVEGANLGTGFALSLWKEGVAVECLQVKGLDGGRHACTFDLRGAGTGTFNLTVKTMEGLEATLPACITVLAQKEPGKSPSPTGTGGGGGESGSGTPGAGNADMPAAPGGIGDGAAPGGPAPESPGEQGGADGVRDKGPAPGGIGAFRVTPSTVSAALSVDLLIEGGTFYAGLRARMTQAGSVAWSVSCEILSETQMRCRFNLAGMAPGIYKLEITDYQGQVIYNVGYVKVI
ncbi:MAG: hypothetical protein H5T73_08835 [Actinobacteria bacterium]|nr:hypothetical protein [Actinomycetota bacterium]